MNERAFNLIDKLMEEKTLTLEEYAFLISAYSQKTRLYAQEKANIVRKKIYGNDVYIRGLIEISNICKNDCFYCGIRHGNKDAERYRLYKDEILEACKIGYDLGFRTFVLQGGEDPYYTDGVLVDIVSEVRSLYPDCAITLSLGERSYDSYKRLYTAGANRYLLRHETADSEHYGKLHPKTMLLEDRMGSLKALKEIGYQTGCGFMVGSPYQTAKTLAKDLKFIEEFKPAMCGIGPFIPHCQTPFRNEKPGDPDFTCYLLSLIRLIVPNVLLPATTALGSIGENGREKGILAGANVIMPNLSPMSVRDKYALYDGKIYQGAEAAECLDLLKDNMKDIGYEVVIARGDVKTDSDVLKK